MTKNLSDALTAANIYHTIEADNILRAVDGREGSAYLLTVEGDFVDRDRQRKGRRDGAFKSQLRNAIEAAGLRSNI